MDAIRHFPRAALLRGLSGAWNRAVARLTPRPAAPAPGGFALVQSETRMHDLPAVEKHLPEILGRALARGWIDRHFRAALACDPKGLLERYGVHLPQSISIEVEAAPNTRERIVVYEGAAPGARRRLLYLQLVMVAGR